VKVTMDSNGCERAIELAGMSEIEAIHAAADLNGDEIGTKNPRFIKDMIREIHTTLVEKGNRDEITLLASGGIALAQHLAKIMICGADLAAINLPLLIALECQLCNRCKRGMTCPAKLETIDFEYGAGRMTNLISAWHDQLIEVMGAMGMREARRLRGDVGRGMFFEQLEEETFGKLFGTKK
jgi:NAD(P)H-dependent flavin oxidoreductase YrpB (nitropropane dioxygenase family)